MRTTLLTAIIFLTITVSVLSLPPFDLQDVVSSGGPKITDTHSYFDANNLLMFVTNRGSIAEDWTLFLSLKNDGFYYPYTGDCSDIVTGTQDKTVLFSAGIWIGGKVDGAIRVAIGAFDTPEYFPGPADATGNHLPDEPRFKVYKIRRDSSIWLDPAKPECARHDSADHFNDWQLWKTEAVADGAPLDDSGNPLLLGDETLWAVYNDGGEHIYHAYGGGTEPLGVEIHQTVWGSDGPGEENVLYVKYKFYNKSPMTIDSFYISFWADPDLGGPSDDLVGCHPWWNVFFVYNGDPYDSEYGHVPAAWGGKVVSGPVIPSPGDTAIFDGNPLPDHKNIGMTSFNKFINGTDPDIPVQTYGYMQGFNAVNDCPTCPYIDPTTGQPTKFPYTGEPVTGQGWLDSNPADRRLLVNFGPMTFNPGDSQQVVLKLGAYAEGNYLQSLSMLRNILDSTIPIYPADFVEADSVQTIIPPPGLETVYFTPPEECWISGVNWGGNYFNGGVDYGYNFWGGYLNPETMADSFSTVEVRFTDNDPAAGQRAYNYCRGCDPNYGYQGYFQVPFQVWDVTNNRQLNVCFVEWIGSTVYDGTWGPSDEGTGGREYLLILNSDYDGDDLSDAGTGAINYTTEDFLDGGNFDFMYGGWFRVRFGHTLEEMNTGQKLVFDYTDVMNAEGVTDSIFFGEIAVGESRNVRVKLKCFSPIMSVLELQFSPEIEHAFFASSDKLHMANQQIEPVILTFKPSWAGLHEGFMYVVDSISGAIKDQVKLVGVASGYICRAWHVSTTGDDVTGDGSFVNPFATIQHAIDTSHGYDTVLVHDGTYTGDGNRDIHFRGKSTVLTSENGANATMIDCQGSAADPHQAFNIYLYGDSSAVIRGFTVRDGFSEHYGAAASISNSTPIFMDCVFRNNTAASSARLTGGGAIFSTSASSISRCTFTGNAADHGGAIYYQLCSSPQIEECTFEGNQAQFGGGIYAFNTDITIAGGVFHSNTAVAGSGVTLYWMDSYKQAEIINSTFALNFSDSAAENNSVIYCQGPANLSLANSIIAFNTQSAAVFCDESEGTCTVGLSCCDLFGNELGDWTGLIADQAGINGNFSADPMFCDAEHDNFSLDRHSPCTADNNSCGILIGALGVGCHHVDYVYCDSVQILSAVESPLNVYFLPPSERWLTAAYWGGDYFFGGVDFGYNFWGGYLDPSSMPDSFSTVELRFTNNDSEVGQRAYNYLRPGYSYQDYFKVPFEAWDVDHNRQVNVCFVEWSDSEVYDSTWGPDTSNTGGREYLLICRSDYDGDNQSDAGTGVIDYTTEDFYHGDNFDFLYGAWLRVDSGHSITEMAEGQELVFDYGQNFLPGSNIDSIMFGQTISGDTASQNLVIKCFTSWRSLIQLLLSDETAFSLSDARLDLGDKEFHSVTIMFTPPGKGYYSARLYAIDSVSGVMRDMVTLFGTTPTSYDGPVWHVSNAGNDSLGDGSGEFPFATIQHAVDASHDFDTVLVHDGTYTGEGNRDIHFRGKSTVLTSENGANATIIDCQGSAADPHQAFNIYLYGDSSSVIRGFTVRDGFSEYYGAAASISNSTPIFMDCVFRNNTAASSARLTGGGAIFSTSAASFSKCTFKGNEADHGGAIYYQLCSSPQIEECTFEDNLAQIGGGVYAFNTDITIAGGVFHSNTAVAGSGVTLYWMDSYKQAEIINSTFALNFSDSAAENNSVIYCQGPALLSVAKSIIAFNSQTAAVFCDESEGTCTVGLSCCDLFGNELGDWTGLIADQAGINGNFSADPVFCLPEYNDFHVDITSPCTPETSPCGALVGALGVGCGINTVTVQPDFLYMIYQYALNPIYVHIYLSDLEESHTVYDIDTSAIFINGTIKPDSIDYVPATDTSSEALEMVVSCDAFIGYYMPIWETLMHEYTVEWSWIDKLSVETYGWVTLLGFPSGDVDGSGTVGILDITYIVQYLYKSGPPPVPSVEAGDVDGSGSVNILDVSYLANYLYKDGPAPVRPGQ